VFKRLSLSGFFNLKNYIYHSGHTQKYCCKWGWTLKNSAVVRYQQQFQPMNKAEQKFISSSLKQIQAAVPGGTFNEFPTCSNTQRWWQV
jgi:hypothetical protein